MARRLFVALLVACVGAGLLAPARAAKREPGTYFRAETAGSPVGTVVGEWTSDDDGRAVELSFRGAHVRGGNTSFVGGWLTPWAPAGEEPRFATDFVVRSETPLGERIVLYESFRTRLKGRGWSQWYDHRIVLQPGSSSVAGGSGLATWAGGKRRWRPQQFEWRIEGRLEVPTTYIEGTFSLTTK